MATTAAGVAGFVLAGFAGVVLAALFRARTLRFAFAVLTVATIVTLTALTALPGLGR